MPAKEVRIGRLIFDKTQRCIIKENTIIPLTAKEYLLLSFLAERPGRVVSKKTLLKKVWGYSHSGYNHTVETHINRLRLKIEEDPADPRILVTVWGSGYKLVKSGRDGPPGRKSGADGTTPDTV